MKTRILTLALIALVPFTAKADCVSTLIGSGINPLAATNICTIQGNLNVTDQLITAGGIDVTGGDLVMDGAGSSFILSSSTITSAGSAQGDATPITTAFVSVAGASGTEGALLPAITAPGEMVAGINTGAGVLRLYPNTGESINAGSVNGSVNIAAGAMWFCFVRTSTNWRCGEMPAA